MWKHLKHPNIVPFLGAITADPLQLVSEWMPGGNLTEYVTCHSDPDRLSLVGAPSIVFYSALTPSPVI